MRRQRMRRGGGGGGGGAPDAEELLMGWLRRMLDEERLEGLRWEDRAQRKFRIPWTHRSAEKWSEREVEVQMAWARHKGKNIDLSLLEKKSTDPATLKAKSNILKKIKATFRCALNSKKELHLYSKSKTHRYWQILDSSTATEEPKVQKKRKSKLPPDELMEEITQRFDIGKTMTPQIQCENVTSSSFAATPSADIHENVYTMQDISETNDACSALPAFSSFNEGYNPVTPPNQATDWDFQATETEDVSSTFATRSLLTPPTDQTPPTDEKPSPSTLTYWSDSTRDTFSVIEKLEDTTLANCENVPSARNIVVKTYQVLNSINSDLEEFLEPFMNSSDTNVNNTSSNISSKDISSSCGDFSTSMSASQPPPPCEATNSYVKNTSNTSFPVSSVDLKQEENSISSTNGLTGSLTSFKIPPSVLKQATNYSNSVIADLQTSSNNFMNTFTTTSTFQNSNVFLDCFSTLCSSPSLFDYKSALFSPDLSRKERNCLNSSELFAENNQCPGELFLDKLMFSRSCDYNLHFT